MPQEITVSTGLRVLKGKLDYQIATKTTKPDFAGTRVHRTTQNIGFAAHEALGVGDLGSAGWASFTNTEAAGGNFVEVGRDVAAAFVPVAKILPGETAQFRASTLLLYAKADTGAVNLDYMISEA